MTLSGFCTLQWMFPSTSAASTGSLPTEVPADITMPSDCHASSKCVLVAAGLVAGGAIVGYFVGSAVAARTARINSKVNLGCEKVADSVDIEDIGEKKAFCRCWKSEKFPYCDGAHNKHNKETGDNVGPVIVKGKPAAQ